MWSFFFYSRGLILTYILLLCWLLHNCSSLTAARKRRMVSFGVLSLQHFVRIFFFFLPHNTISIARITKCCYCFNVQSFGPSVLSTIDVHIFSHNIERYLFLSLNYVWSRCSISDWCTRIRPYFERNCFLCLVLHGPGVVSAIDVHIFGHNTK